MPISTLRLHRRAGERLFEEGFAPTERRLGLWIAGADIAAFFARQLADCRYCGQAIGLSI